ncbi:hypothetical protein DPMN_079801 [Dreissena polymorpha]|uniref:Uncharacterized protein n=1 Tax=Dreissena polymorpha TaxID=45954 RepID=A0A9D3YT87_DREPO|nr:hypothetical protein DPMN_079801 [Dreissena polymorpha]
MIDKTFELGQDVIGTNVLNKFHKDRAINVASRVITRQMLTTNNAPMTRGDHTSTLRSANCPTPGYHVFKRTGTIFKLDIMLTRKTALTPDASVWNKIMNTFHEYWNNVTARVVTRFHCRH